MRNFFPLFKIFTVIVVLITFFLITLIITTTQGAPGMVLNGSSDWEIFVDLIRNMFNIPVLMGVLSSLSIICLITWNVIEKKLNKNKVIPNEF